VILIHINHQSICGCCRAVFIWLMKPVKTQKEDKFSVSIHRIHINLSKMFQRSYTAVLTAFEFDVNQTISGFIKKGKIFSFIKEINDY
jgi:hypothetical protein